MLNRVAVSLGAASAAFVIVLALILLVRTAILEGIIWYGVLAFVLVGTLVFAIDLISDLRPKLGDVE